LIIEKIRFFTFIVGSLYGKKSRISTIILPSTTMAILRSKKRRQFWFSSVYVCFFMVRLCSLWSKAIL